MAKSKRVLFSRLWRTWLTWLWALLATGLLSQAVYAKDLVLVAADSRPTAYMKDGKPVGILVDLVTEAFRRSGQSVKIQLMPWARCLAEVRDGNVDGIFSVFKLPEREAFLAYTDIPVITQVEVFFVHADSRIRFNGNLAALANHRVGVIRDTSYGPGIDTLIKNGTWAKVTHTSSVDSLVAMLAAKRIDISPSYRYVFLDAAKQAGSMGKIKELTPAVESIPSYLAFNKKRDYAQTIAEFNKALASMKADKSFDAIYAKYMQ
ncbi:polar amino acid transport system substrate-binding protein [Rhodoferax sp. OV413]|nr:polar amino acid transport system substrate-binding protein [Rhodoferax sp. OV413]